MTVTESPELAPTPDRLPPMDVSARLPRLRQHLDELGCDALVVSELTNVRYLTGFTGSAALLLVSADGVVFVTDGRYKDRSAEEHAQEEGGSASGPTQRRSGGYRMGWHAVLLRGAIGPPRVGTDTEL